MKQMKLTLVSLALMALLAMTPAINGQIHEIKIDTVNGNFLPEDD